MIKTKIVDALNAVDSRNLFIQTPKILHCNEDGTYYLYNNSRWIAFEMIAGLDYYELNAFGIAASQDGSTPVKEGNITVVF